MGRQKTNILWLQDTLEQLHKTQQQLQWTRNPETIQVLTEAMVRDLENCRHLCEEMNRRARVRQTV